MHTEFIRLEGALGGATLLTPHSIRSGRHHDNSPSVTNSFENFHRNSSILSEHYLFSENKLMSMRAVFEFTSGVETVVEVSAEDFNKCSNDEVIDMMYEGPAVVNLNTAGWRYFYSDVGLCCEAGQKLAVNVIKPRQPHKAYDSHPPPGRGEAHASPPVSG
ncbi:Early nodulin-like protein 1 [Apostasia shenzhenica]|uniref:Early nodulin-like protein 1 n=1 Tax=Apostasia shenzhenica TaxID=1088818 RepID=A0A2I0AT42_9ASPA|nr:Early nodulin-like protein 1 [Apostasia shenzhenica]